MGDNLLKGIFALTSLIWSFSFDIPLSVLHCTGDAEGPARAMNGTPARELGGERWTATNHCVGEGGVHLDGPGVAKC